jgi:hypothetical protein
MFFISKYDIKNHAEAVTMTNHSPYGPVSYGVITIDPKIDQVHLASLGIHELWHSFKSLGIIALDVPYASAAGFYHEYSESQTLYNKELIQYFNLDDSIGDICTQTNILLEKYSNILVSESQETYTDGARLAGLAYVLDEEYGKSSGSAYIWQLANGVDACIAFEVIKNPDTREIAKNYLRGAYIQIDYQNLANDINLLNDSNKIAILNFVESLDRSHISILKYLSVNKSNNRDGELFKAYYEQNYTE